MNFLSSIYIDGTFLFIFFKYRRNYNIVGTDQHTSYESWLSRTVSVILFTLGGNPRIPDARGAARVKVSSEAYSCVKRLKDRWREDIVFDYNFSNFKWKRRERKIKTINNTISLSRNGKDNFSNVTIQFAYLKDEIEKENEIEIWNEYQFQIKEGRKETWLED